MKLTSALFALLTVSSINAASLPQEVKALSLRDAVSEAEPLYARDEEFVSLEKRKGGGGGRSGGSSSGGSSGGSSSGGGRSGSGSGSSSGGSSGGRTGSSSNSGGSTSGGSGRKPTFGGGAGGRPVYAGGAATPYTAGRRSPLGLTPFLLGGAALGALLFIPALAAAGAAAYFYDYPDRVTYFNGTDGNNQTHQVKCFCLQYQECGCDNNTNSTYINSIVGNGTKAALNSSGSAVAPNGTLYIDGSLPNGTTAATSGATSSKNALEAMGWWMMVATVGSIVFFT